MADTALAINKMVLPNKKYASDPITLVQTNNHVLPVSGDSTKTFFHVVVGSDSDPFTLNVVAGDYSDSVLGDLEIACKAEDDFYFNIETARFRTADGNVTLTMTVPDVEGAGEDDPDVPGVAVGTIEVFQLP